MPTSIAILTRKLGGSMPDGTPIRAGLWPRAIALLIDGCLISVVLGLVGLVLFGPTGGKIRVSEMLVGSQTCTQQNPQILQNLDSSIPANFQTSYIVRCTKSVLGHVHDHVLIIGEITRSGPATRTRELTLPVD